MKLFYSFFIIATALMFSPIGAYADDVGVNIDGKNILITLIENGFGSKERVLHSKDLTDGIFVLVMNGSPRDRLPHAEAIIRDQLVASGYKVSDKVNGASIAITFSAGGSMSMDNADKQAANSSLPNTGQVASNAGALIAGSIVGGPAAAAGFIAGALFPVDEKTQFSGLVAIKPVQKSEGKWINSGIDGDDGYFADAVLVKYKLEKENKASEDVVLKMLADQWIKRYLVLDGDSSTVTPAVVSAVTASVTLEK